MLQSKHRSSRHPLAAAGTYLPLTAVLGGSLFVRAEGYREADRDVVRLSPHISELQEQVLGCAFEGTQLTS